MFLCVIKSCHCQPITFPRNWIWFVKWSPLHKNCLGNPFCIAILLTIYRGHLGLSAQSPKKVSKRVRGSSRTWGHKKSEKVERPKWTRNGPEMDRNQALSSELSGAICLKTLVLLASALELFRKSFATARAIFGLCESFLWLLIFVAGRFIGRTPKGAYSPRGRSRHLLETPFSEPHLRTLLRTLFYCKTHRKGLPSQKPSEHPSPEPFPEPSQDPNLRTLRCRTTP